MENPIDKSRVLPPSASQASSDGCNQVLAELLQRVENGSSLDIEAAVADYPEFERQIREFAAARGSLARLFQMSALGQDVHGRRTPDYSLLEGNRIFGDYELLEGIGGGGMGEVYKARQSSLNRIVALKFIREHHQNVDGLKRFQNEAQILAKLQHPNIVRIIQVDHHQGRDFLAMEFIEGFDLRRLIEFGSLEFTESAIVMSLVADGLHAAHQQGILHRDLKPSNILIEQQSFRPLISDFGLAKSISEATGLTATQDTLGTPEYMAPEQLRAGKEKGSIAADIYALGATLYQLLVGQPPYVAANHAQVIKLLLQTDPISPRTFNPSIPRDLETICRKCMERNPNLRYDSAADVAEDLRRFLARKPIMARPVSTLGRCWRWAIRHPAAAGLLSMVGVFVLAVPITLVIVNNLRLSAISERNNAIAANADLQKLSDYLVDILRRPDPMQDGRRITVAEALESAERKALSELNDQPMFQGMFLSAIGRSYDGLGLTKEAVGAQDRALSILGKHLPQHDRRVLLATAYRAVAYQHASRFDEARQALENCRREWSQRYGESGREYQTILGSLAEIYHDASLMTESLALYSEMHERAKRELGPDDLETLSAQQWRAYLLTKLNKCEEALPLLDDALARYERTVGLDYLEAVQALGKKGSTCRILGRFYEAVKCHEEALSRLTRILGEEHPQTLRAMTSLAHCWIGTKEHGQDAAKLYLKRYELSVKVLGTDARDTFAAQSFLGMAYDNLGQTEKAREAFEETTKISERTFGIDHEITNSAYRSYVGFLQQHGELTAAVDLALRRLHDLRQLGTPDDLPRTRLEQDLAKCYAMTGRFEEAAGLQWDVLSSLREYLHTQNRALTDARAYAAEFGIAAKHYDKVLTLLEEVFVELSKDPSTPPRWFGEAYCWRAEANAGLGNLSAARKSIEQSIEAFTRDESSDQQSILLAQTIKGSICRQSNEIDVARDYLQRGLRAVIDSVPTSIWRRHVFLKGLEDIIAIEDACQNVAEADRWRAVLPKAAAWARGASADEVSSATQADLK